LIPNQSKGCVAIPTEMPYNTFGLYVSDGEAWYGFTSAVPCVVLLIGEQLFHIPKQCVRLVSEKEIEETLRDG
jgi:hypothetical protein